MSSTIPDPSNSQNPDSKPVDNQDPDAKPCQDQTPGVSNQSDKQDEKGENGEEEEEGECGFCLFMKGGGCKDAFIAWEQCVEEAEKTKEDVVEKCFEVTATLKKCMEAHSDYYEPILRAEKAAEEEVKQELQRESEKKNGEQNSGSKGIEETVEIAVENES